MYVLTHVLSQKEISNIWLSSKDYFGSLKQETNYNNIAQAYRKTKLIINKSINSSLVYFDFMSLDKSK